MPLLILNCFAKGVARRDRNQGSGILQRNPDRVQSLTEGFPDLSQDTLEHMLLGREVVVERAEPDVGMVGNLFDRRLLVPALQHQLAGRGEQCPARAFLAFLMPVVSHGRLLARSLTVHVGVRFG